MNKSGPQVVLRTYYCVAYTICVEISLHCKPSNIQFKIGRLHQQCRNLLCLASPATYNFKLLVGEEPQKNWVTLG